MHNEVPPLCLLNDENYLLGKGKKVKFIRAKVIQSDSYRQDDRQR